MSTPRDPTESKQAKNGRSKAITFNSSNSLAIAAPPPNADEMVKWWRAFKRFMADCDELAEYYGSLWTERIEEAEHARTPAELEDDADWCQKLVAKCEAGLERFDPEDNYEQDHEGNEMLKTGPIAARLGMMIGSFINTLPQSPELFGRAMIEQVADIEGLSMPALETACREIVRTEKWPDIPKVVAVVSEHINEWNTRRRAVFWVERERLELISILTKREEKKKKGERERAITGQRYAVNQWIRETQRLAREIEAGKVALAEEIERRNARLAMLAQKLAEAERRESEEMRKLRALTMTEEEQEEQAIAKANRAGSAELRLIPPRAPCTQARSER
jgi:hypothetical protein